MPSKKDADEKAIERAMPGWKVVKRRPASDAREEARAYPQPDAVSPGLAAQQAKSGAARKAIAPQASAKKKGARARFVTVSPAAQPDTVRKFQKVVLVKDGKVLAQQG
jgi:hypothetical protein